MRLITNDQVRSALSKQEILTSVKNGIIAEAKRKLTVPPRMHLEHDANTSLLMPAYNDQYFITKIVHVIPANPSNGLPLIQGQVYLYDRKTGEPLAQFDASQITALRTGAVGALGLDLISPKDVTQLGIFGCGVQAIYQTIFAKAVRNCLLYTSPSPRDATLSRMPSSA